MDDPIQQDVSYGRRSEIARLFLSLLLLNWVRRPEIIVVVVDLEPPLQVLETC